MHRVPDYICLVIYRKREIEHVFFFDQPPKCVDVWKIFKDIFADHYDYLAHPLDEYQMDVLFFNEVVEYFPSWDWKSAVLHHNPDLKLS